MILPAGSKQPSFSMTVLDGDTPPTGLNTATIALVAVRGSTEVIRDTSPTVNATTGLLTHTWVGTQTDEATDLFWHAEVNFGGGIVVFPQLGELVTRIR